jgi:uncharacterized membrane protein YccC
MSSSAAAEPSSMGGAGAPASAPGKLGSPWWRVSWSKAAALRAVRAVIVIPCLLALTFKVLHNEQMTLFAVFGSFGALVFASFGGGRRHKALAHLDLAVAGSVALVLGTLASNAIWVAVLVTLPVAFAIFFAGSAGPNAASGVTACLLAFVLPVASTGPVSVIPDRLEGWWLAQAVSTAAVLLLSPRSPGDKLRALAAKLARALVHQLEAAVNGKATAADAEASRAATLELRNAYVAAPYRPIGLAASDQGLAALIHLLEWCTELIRDAADGHLDLPAAAAEDRELLAQSARALRAVAALMTGAEDSARLEQIWRARLASAQHLNGLASDRETAVAQADYAFHAQAIGIATSAAVADAMAAAGRASPARLADLRRWLNAQSGAGQSGGLTADELPPSPHDHLGDPPLARWLGWLGLPKGVAAAFATDASLRSVWFRNSARGAGALALAVAVAKLTGVQHAFWVVLGTLSVLRTSAAATGSTAMRALAGTTAGFIVGAALLLAIGTNPVALWIAFPVAVLVAAYTPGTAPFAAGQAAFTITVVVLFNVLVPAGWRVGLLRVEDVAIGCAVSLVVGYLFWPRGASSVLGDNLADAFRCGSRYLGEAVSWALGEQGRRPDQAVVAIAAGIRLDDAIRFYMTEQGSKRMDKSDLWGLVLGARRLRLTAHSIASLPARAEPHADDDCLHAVVSRELDGIVGFYGDLAAAVARPPRRDAHMPDLAEPPHSAPASAALSTCRAGRPYRSDALWVGHQLDDLQVHAGDLVAPAERLAALRRRPWWR